MLLPLIVASIFEAGFLSKDFYAGLFLFFAIGLTIVGPQSLFYTLLMEFIFRKLFFPSHKATYIAISTGLGLLAGISIEIIAIVMNNVLESQNHQFLQASMKMGLILALVGAIAGLLTGLVLWWLSQRQQGNE